MRIDFSASRLFCQKKLAIRTVLCYTLCSIGDDPPEIPAVSPLFL